MKVYVIRMRYQNQDLRLKKCQPGNSDFVTIGWLDANAWTNCLIPSGSGNKSLNQDWKNILEYKKSANLRSTTSWHLILHNIKKNDLICVPLPGEFILAQVIASDKPILEADYTNGLIKLPVTVLGIFKRANSSQILQRKMKVQQTVCHAGKAEILFGSENITEIVTQLRTPSDLQIILSNSAKQSICEALSFKNGKSALNPQKFEHLLGSLMEKMGADIDYPGKAYNGKRGDVDVIASFTNLKHCVHIQAKHHEGKEGDEAINQLIEARNGEDNRNFNGKDDYTHSWWAVTTAHFSDSALKKAAENGIRCIDVDELAEMLLNVGLADL